VLRRGGRGEPVLVAHDDSRRASEGSEDMCPVRSGSHRSLRPCDPRGRLLADPRRQPRQHLGSPARRRRTDEAGDVARCGHAAAPLHLVGDGQAPRPGVVAVRGRASVDEDEPDHELRVPLGQRERHVPAHREACDDDLVDPAATHRCRHRVGGHLHGRRQRTVQRRRPEPGEVRCDDGDVVGEHRDDVVPHAVVEREAVEQDEAGAASRRLAVDVQVERR
jgi:hypothetical protein